jgi:hypothetical protein
MVAYLLASMMGCTPHDAVVEGTYWTWLAANSSATVAEGKLTALDVATRFDCSGRGWNEDTESWDAGYIGPREDDDSTGDQFVGGDCAPDDSDCDQDALDAACEGIAATEYHTFLQDDGFYGLTGALEPWRTEALLNSEGDFQLTVHHDLGDGQDFRFHFTIDPDFAPVNCVTDDSGNGVEEPIDGSDWLTEWSVDEDGATIYYLNAGAYQVNPSNSDEWWYLDTDVLSGYGVAKFAAEEFGSQATTYGNYDENGDGENFRAIDDEDDWTEEEYAASYADHQAAAEGWEAEMNDVARMQLDGAGAFEHKTESNDWRPMSYASIGLGGWMELQSSWVRINDGAKFEEDGSVSGDYQIMYDGIEAGSILVVRGTFSVEKLRTDKWGYTNLEDEKRAQNGTPYCSPDTGAAE